MAKTTAAAAVHKARIKSPKQDAPRASAPGALAVYDGQDLVGRIVEQDGVYWTFGIDDVLIGAFATLRDDMRELPRC